MMKINEMIYLFLSIGMITGNVSYSQLTVRTDTYGSKPGYIDNATLVVEPHGAFVEQSLYLSYADHNQFPSSQVEIVHRFQLPANAVVNDLWLWIGDSIMQAIILDTWKARAIYDSIVSKKRDPAFLTKNGNLYELHVYPLQSGGYRKIKLNFITPTQWLGKDGVAELPLKMLQNNNAQIKPVQVLFKEAEQIWGIPTIKELPQQEFEYLKDTSGYKYTYTTIADITSLSSFTVAFTVNFNGGYFITTADVKNDATYFQFGFNPGSLFNLQIDSTSQHLVFAYDFSGVHNKNFTTLIPKVKQLMNSAAKPNDSIAVVIAGAGKIEKLNTEWKTGNPDTINSMMDRFVASEWGNQVAHEKMPNVLYADGHASICWQFPGIEQLATYTNYGGLMPALNDFEGADVIAAYNHGYEDAGSTAIYLPSILSKIDSFFAQGGRFLSYFDYNRVGRELIGTHYISGLFTTRRTDVSTTLYRNPNGNIGIYFPESLVHYGFDYLQYTPDSTVRIELQDIDGNPVVISKKIGNGLLVVSGIWSFRDDGALRALLGVPLLGLNEVKKNQQLTGLLNTIKSTYLQSPFDKVILLSNSDSLFQKPDALSWSASYFNGFGNVFPKFTTVNLLEGAGYLPPYVTDEQIQYYGSGFLLKTIASASDGRHFETHSETWPYIVTSLNAYSYPFSDSSTVSVVVDSGAGQLKELREVNPVKTDPNKARFFIGAATIPNTIQFNIRAKFNGIADEKYSSTTVHVNHDTTKMEKVLPSMVGNEQLKDLFNQPIKDTARIVSLAMQYRLLCDFTAFLALEPNDTIHFLKNPIDEGLLNISEFIDENMADSLLLTSYPNPFNNRTNIVINIKNTSLISVGIYNILGQRVTMLTTNEIVDGTQVYSWNGTDTQNHTVSSGLYFIRMIAKDQRSDQIVTRLRKILFLK